MMMYHLHVRKNLFGLSLSDLLAEIKVRELPSYRAKQLYSSLYARGVSTLDDMTDLPLELRSDLAESFEIRHLSLGDRHMSSDGTLKYSFVLEDGNSVETVYIPEERDEQPDRHTFCLSTQIGCPLKCTFCFSGTVAFQRNLSVGEILGQFQEARCRLPKLPTRSNIVFMGMGEPMLNSEAVQRSLEILIDPDAFAVSPQRITVSTAGLAEELESFAESVPKVGLAISLHATRDSVRDRLMPINRKYSIQALIEAARRLPLSRRRSLTFEYTLLGGENDTEGDAHRLAKLLTGLYAKVNLIEFNPWPGTFHKRSDRQAMKRFAEILKTAGVNVNFRRSRGDDVLAACGQLANHKAEPAVPIDGRA